MPYFTVSEKWIDVNVSPRFGAKRGDANYHAGIDVNRDGIIDMLDVAWFVQRVGQVVFVPDVAYYLVFRYWRVPWKDPLDLLWAAKDELKKRLAQPPTAEELEEFRKKGDVNKDGKVDDADLGLVNAAFGSKPGDANWNPDCDLNGDGKIDISDMAIVTKNYGRDLLMERQNVLIDYPVEIKAGPWWTEELWVTCYDDVGTTLLLLLIMIILLVTGIVMLAQDLRIAELNKRLQEVHVAADKAIDQLHDLADQIAADPTIPEATKKDLLNKIGTLTEQIKKARDTATTQGGSWVDWLWQMGQYLPIIFILIGAAILVPIITKLIPGREH
jgi:hypothetical protein